jgi:hypothetical protein
MSTITATKRTDEPATTHVVGSQVKTLSFGRVVRSEWIKQRTLRTTVITLAAMLVAIVGFGLIAAMTATGSVATQGPFSTDRSPVATVLTGSNLAVLIVVTLGVLTGAREYSSGMIRSTLAAVPSRLPVLWAKSLSFVGVVLPVSLIGIAAAFAGGTSILSAAGVASATWTDPGVLRALLGTAGYLVGLGLIGLSFGVILRSIGGALGTVIGGLLFLPTLAGALLPDSWSEVLKYLPSNAAQAFTSVTSPDALLSPMSGGVVFVAWVVASVVGAAVVLKRRDA